MGRSGSDSDSSRERKKKKAKKQKSRKRSRSRERRSKSRSRRSRSYESRRRSRSRDRRSRSRDRRSRSRSRRSKSRDRRSRSRDRRSRSRSRKSRRRSRPRSRTPGGRRLSRVRDPSPEVEEEEPVWTFQSQAAQPGGEVVLTIADELKRARAIAEIEGETFVQSDFRTEHLAKLQGKEAKVEGERFDFGTSAEAGQVKDAGLAHPKLFGDQAKREKRFLQTVFALRQAALAEGD